MDNEFLTSVDTACISTLTEISPGNQICMFYNIYKCWPQHIYDIYLNGTVIEKNTAENYDDEYNSSNDIPIDIAETHKNLMKMEGILYRKLSFTDCYFMPNKILCYIENVSMRIYSFDDRYAIHISNFINALVKKDIKEYSDVGILVRDTRGEWYRESLRIDKMDIDINATYNDDICDNIDKIDDFISNDDSGIIMFHGEPGTGKSTFIKYIIQKHDEKNFIILNSDILSYMSDSTFIGFLLSNKNAIYIIEDAEKLIESRKSYTSSNVLSSFLNLSDGLTANAIKSKFICTFNENVSNIDAAVMRKGRLKLKFEFKKLCVEKAQRINPDITAPISLADLFNMQENDFTKKPVRQIGFH